MSFFDKPVQPMRRLPNDTLKSGDSKFHEHSPTVGQTQSIRNLFLVTANLTVCNSAILHSLHNLELNFRLLS
jgi:hypothetical protein